MNLENSHLEVIRNSKFLRKHVEAVLKNQSLIDVPLESMSTDDSNDLYNAAYDAWFNESPKVLSYSGYTWDSYGGGSWEEFPLGVNGIEGAYYVFAQEFDEKGPFATLIEAKDYLEAEYYEFLRKPVEDF